VDPFTVFWISLSAAFMIVFLVAFFRRPQYSFEDRTVLITGGSRGLGLVLARQLVKAGARVAICARDSEELRRAKIELTRSGGSVLEFTCDVSDREQVQHMIWQIHQLYGPIDVLINNAGVIQVAPMETMVLEDYEEAMRIHFWGPLYLTLAVWESMKQRRSGRIANITSIGGKISVPHLLPYSASKFALVGFSEGLRAESEQYNIRVTTVCPGLMRTGSPRNAIFKSRHRDEYAWFTILDSLPVISIHAERAARQILRGIQQGRAEVYPGLPSKIAIPFHGLFPGLTSMLMALMNRLLPKPGGIGTHRASGAHSRSPMTRSWLTHLSDQAALKNNEIHTNHAKAAHEKK
jgi:short-subunit dehydrogenase